VFRMIPLALAFTIVLSGCFENKAMKELKSRNIQYNSKDFVDNAASGNTEVVSLFLKAGIDPNAADSTGRMALWEAKRSDFPEVVALLISAGASYKSSLPVIIKEIKNPDATIRHKALEVIKSLGPGAADAVTPLAEIINSPIDYLEIALIIQALKSIGTTSAVNAASEYENMLNQQKARLNKQKAALEKDLIYLAKESIRLEKQAEYNRQSVKYARGHDVNQFISNAQQSQTISDIFKQKFQINSVEYEKTFGRDELLSFTQRNNLELFLSQ
jgi:hypothetical protein